MTPEHATAVRHAAELAYRLAAIEKSAAYAEQCGTTDTLPRIIRDILADVETVAPDDMTWARRAATGLYR
jgi:hypothetical protein